MRRDINNTNTKDDYRPYLTSIWPFLVLFAFVILLILFLVRITAHEHIIEKDVFYEGQNSLIVENNLDATFVLKPSSDNEAP